VPRLYVRRAMFCAGGLNISSTAGCRHACKTHTDVPTYCLTALRVIQLIVNNSTTDVLFGSLYFGKVLVQMLLSAGM